MNTITADLYLRLSDFRADDADSFPQRQARLEAKAAELGWKVHRVATENDVTEDGRRMSASAFKRKKITTPNGRVELRTIRPQFRSIITDLETGAANAVLAEDLDRMTRDPRDMEDLIDAIAGCRGHARSISGSLMLTDGGTSDQVVMARIMCNMANKASADTARRVADGRERTAALGSYGGGQRRYGFRHDPDAPKYHKTLIINEDEAAWLRKAADAVMAEGDDRKSLRWMASEMRRQNIPTVTGAAWSAGTLRNALCKPAVAGIMVNTRTGIETAGAWPAILDREVWEAVVAKLKDPSRRTNHDNANSPVWLGSGIYLCGACADGVTSVEVHGVKESRAYMCKAKAHLRRKAVETDATVGMWVSDRIARYPDLLRPRRAVRPGVDRRKLESEQQVLEVIRKRQVQMVTMGDMDADEWLEAKRTRNTRLAQIAQLLAETPERDPLAEFRGAMDADAAWAIWKNLTLPRQRSVLAKVAVVTLLPRTRGGPGFDRDSVRVEPTPIHNAL